MEYEKKYSEAVDMEMCDVIILKGTLSEPCTVCGRPTPYVDVCYEAHVCSDECQAVLDREITQLCIAAVEESC